MSSRFVSGGTIAGDNANTQATPSSTSQSPPAASAAQSSAWEKAEAQLKADRQAREAARKAAVESGSGQSLYDVLQANKAAKQAAFEEAAKLRNQFRALDDDEVDFLEGMVADERRQAEEQRRAEEERLKEFRDAQKRKGSGTAEEDEVKIADNQVIDEWSTGAARKRKREKEPVIKGIKRRVSEPTKDPSETNGTAKNHTVPAASGQTPAVEGASSTTKTDSALRASTAKPKMSLVNYGSDEDDDDD
ncbi:putative FAM192A/Fyv6 N-terminal domain-containing protein [Seiridium unicorne]|uniref:FAM192A/Fyv6 N-terminal domain-containing protein n=1 Tax=Seiridium unicorne TaxID=138068 RepID=A0ABR2V470_9PEZI